MKFVWFNLMPWPHMPDDFREKHRSVWVDIDQALYDPVEGHRVYHQYMDQLEFADSLGYDGIGVNEHHQNGYGLMPSPNIIAAGLARRTSKAAICVIGNSIALYNPPIRVAEEFAMLDVISGGRLVAGFPVGTSMDTNYCYGQIPALTRDKYAENHDLIMRAWRETEPFAFDGKYNQLRYVNCWPKPIQKPHPPIYIPGGGSIETWDFCVEHEYNYSFLSFGGYLAGKALLDGYWDRVAHHGVDDSPYRAAFAQTICVADTDAEAEELYAEHVLYFYNRCLHVYPGFADAPGYRTINTLKAGALSQLTSAAQRRFSSLTWKDLVEGGHVIAGSPDTVRDRMEDMITNLRIGTVFGLFHVGNMPDWKTRYSTQLFAEKVMPQPAEHVARLRKRRPLVVQTARHAARPARDGRRPGPLGAGNVSALDAIQIDTPKGTSVHVYQGGSGPDLLFLHGTGGLLGAEDPFLLRLAESFTVHAPELPGYGESVGEELLEDMLDFTLHGWDCADALGLDTTAPRRPLDGWDDRRRDGLGRQPAHPIALAHRASGHVARRAPDPRHLCHVAVRPARPCCSTIPLPARRALTGGVGLQRPRSARRVLHPQRPPARHGGQDAVPDSESAAVQAHLPADCADAARVGRERQAHPAGLRRAVARAVADR